MSSTPPPADPSATNPQGAQKPPGPIPVAHLTKLAWLIAPWLFAAAGFWAAMVGGQSVGIGAATGLIVAAFVAFMCATSLQKIHGLSIGWLVYLAYGACLIGFGAITLVIVDKATGFGIIDQIGSWLEAARNVGGGKTWPLSANFSCTIQKDGWIGIVVSFVLIGALLYMLGSIWHPGVVEPMMIATRGVDSKGTRYGPVDRGIAPVMKVGVTAVLVLAVINIPKYIIRSAAECEATTQTEPTVTTQEEPAPAPAQSNGGGSKPRHQQKQKSAKPPKAEPAVAVEERPFLYTVASTAPVVDKGCTTREIGVIAGRVQYSCIPN